MSFESLGLNEPLLRAIRSEGYTTPTDIQRQAIPPVLEGRDMLGCAQTGTGKTAAFALPVLHRLLENKPTGPAPEQADDNTQKYAKRGRNGRPPRHHGPRKPIRALVLTPTRELAAQVLESFETYGRHTGLNATVVFGGVKQGPQTAALRRGVDVLVATPGRLLDLHNQGELDISRVEVFVLDEADRMLDMGFAPDIKRITAEIPSKRQTLFFSATMPKEIQKLADALLHHPVKVTIAAQNSAADTVKQGIYFVERPNKIALLQDLLSDPTMHKTLVFSRTKRGADRIAKRLNASGIPADSIHGDKSQAARTRALDRFKSGKTWVLVGSDVASRGLDVDDISHVINFDLPGDGETYVHRIGRTGRAGATGDAISFCDGEERALLRDIERTIGKNIDVLEHALATGQATKRSRASHPLAATAPTRGDNAGGGNGNSGGNGGGNRPKRNRNSGGHNGNGDGNGNGNGGGSGKPKTKAAARRRRAKRNRSRFAGQPGAGAGTGASAN
ncbi:MAG: DEAD/DEAH box helicase [Phycisphaera sp.]|nr:DEAD/DEAH box helicase [Phycisphaera sp.]